MDIKKLALCTAMAAVLAAPAVTAHAESPQDLPPGKLRQETIKINNATPEESRQGLKEMKAAAKETANDIEAFLIGNKPNGDLKPVMMRQDRTSEGILNKSIVNPKGEKIATVKDIILDSNGNASMIVVSDGGFLGIGDKLAAFKYNDVVKARADGTVYMELSEAMIDRAKEFSYDADDAAEAKVLPAGGISVAHLLEGDLIDQKDNKVASVENIYINDGEASKLIVGFDKTLGLGGKKAAINFNEVKVVKDGDDTDLRLSATQTAEFDRFKKQAE